MADGLDKDWGDTNESCLASALRNITVGVYRSTTTESYRPSSEIIRGNDALDEPFLKITIGQKP